MKTKKLRFAPLVRVSTERQENVGSSLRTQTDQIKIYVEQLGGTVPAACWEYSGQEHATPGQERKKLDQLLQDAGKNKFDAIIVTDPSRWSRDNLKNEQGLEILKQNSIRFFVGAMEYDLHDPTQKFFLSMSAVINEMQATVQAKKSIENRIARAKLGIPSNGRMPFGRTFDKLTNKWGISYKAQQMIKSAGERYAEGESLKDIGISLGEDHYMLFRNLMNNCGEDWELTFEYKKANIKETIQMKIPRLLEQELIDRVHRRRDTNKTSNYGRGNRKYDFLLSGFVFCQKCGHRLMTYRNITSHLQYYRHRTNKHNEDCVFTKVIPGYDLENAVLLQLITTLGDKEKINKAINRATPDLAKIEKLEIELADLKDKLTTVEKRKSNIVDMVAEGSLSKEDVKKQMDTIRQEDQVLSNRIQTIEDQLSSIPNFNQIQRSTQWAVKMTAHVTKNPMLIFKRDYAWKRRLVERAFMGEDNSGKKLGVYVSYDENGKIHYNINAGFETVVNSLPLSDTDIAIMFKLNDEYQNSNEEIEKIKHKLTNEFGKCSNNLIFSIEGHLN